MRTEPGDRPPVVEEGEHVAEVEQDGADHGNPFAAFILS